MKKLKNSLVWLSVLLVAVVLIACQNPETAAQELDILGQIQESGELNVGIAPGYPPYEFYILDENGERQVAGSDTDLAQAIADEIGVRLNFTVTDFNGVIANIQAGSVDMAASGFTYTEKRKESMQFSEGYLQEATVGYQGLMMHEDTFSQFNTLEEVKEGDLVLGAQGGSIQYEIASRLTDEGNVKQYGTLDVGLAALNEGDIDGMVVSTASAEPMLLTFPELVLLPQEEYDLDPELVYSTNVIAFPLGEKYHSLIEVANKVIQENKENGNIAKWQEEATALSREAIKE